MVILILNKYTRDTRVSNDSGKVTAEVVQSLGFFE